MFQPSPATAGEDSFDTVDQMTLAVSDLVNGIHLTAMVRSS